MRTQTASQTRVSAPPAIAVPGADVAASAGAGAMRDGSSGYDRSIRASIGRAARVRRA